MTDSSIPHHSPPRAEPLQPDRPGQGQQQQEDGKSAEKSAEESAAEKAREQSDTARGNVTKGYD